MTASVRLLPVGAVDAKVLEILARRINRILGLPVQCLGALHTPVLAYDETRQQFGSTPLLRAVYQASPPEQGLVLGVTDLDLFIPMLTFVFGHAQLGGHAALVSIARLRQEFYGLPPDPLVLYERSVKTAIHELGHSLGLVHCDDPRCVMRLSTSVQVVDEKETDYCAECVSRLEGSLAALRAGEFEVSPGEEKG